ncbi:hypothetical protein ACOQFO_01220 [Ureibacillus sp. MALMAid1270]|uniref:hypothetical protein n=1 Tax=Ureibacillus sp. MALMAid1270 TaxID=3411629 RepID=UPI003BA49AB0
MFVELLGTVFEGDERVILTNIEEQKAFEISGTDLSKLKLILDSFTGTYNIDELFSKFPELNKNEVINLIMNLEDLKIVRVKEKVDKKIIILTDKIHKEHLLFIKQSPLLKDIADFGNISDNLIDSHFLVGIDYDDNVEYFKTVQKISQRIRKPWLKVSLTKSNILLGPTFFPDDGPCYNCLLERITSNNLNNYSKGIEVLGPIEDYIGSSIMPELIKISKNKYPLSSFETEIIINPFTYENSSYKVLKSPFCEWCNELGG